MNDELGLALAYWRTAAPQPKAIVYANAIEARMKGIDPKDMVADHELANAITRGASVARHRKQRDVWHLGRCCKTGTPPDFKASLSGLDPRAPSIFTQSCPRRRVG
ncbi:hypothetical protein [Chelativorans sp. J32]|uniref:hypothetical protein n=1 Tax=Chelativorans sp. J32 TaxID=935840 RepID=UPI000481EEC1|nr:hypothetical protein [Chelativorans sp. J32]